MGSAVVCKNYLWNPAKKNLTALSCLSHLNESPYPVCPTITSVFIISVPLTLVYVSQLFQFNLFIVSSLSHYNQEDTLEYTGAVLKFQDDFYLGVLG